ncbi:MAG: phosphoglucosamine mutase, partial [Clostridiaceae bacterium]|nr:phosphoglucosamine mutase [Clostridiaceae bacterium]
MTRLFGTDGVRGIANRELTPELAFSLGLAGALVLTEETHHKPTFVVGADTRVSCGMLGAALIAGITSAGADVIYVGVIATPGVAWLTRELGADAGAMISASHNSFEFNGIKLFSGQGFKLQDETEDAIEAVIRGDELSAMTRPVGDRVGRITQYDKGAEDYRNHLYSIAEVDLTGVRLVIDCANGASYQTAPQLFRDLGAEVIAIGIEPDGYNINHDCGSMHAEKLAEYVRESGADAGLAFDGDADRLIVVDDQGDVCDGDVMLAILARDLDRKGKLAQKTIVATVMSNFGLERMAEREGLRLVRTSVGDRYVLEHMLRDGLSLGGEQSGHVILLDDTTTGDGQLTALRLLGALHNLGSKTRLSEARKIIQTLPQVLKNVYVSEYQKNLVMDHP